MTERERLELQYLRAELNEADMILSKQSAYISVLTAERDAALAKLEMALDWAVHRWNDEVKNRPLQNIHRSDLDITWRQVMRHFGGDPDKLVGPEEPR